MSSKFSLTAHWPRLLGLLITLALTWVYAAGVPGVSNALERLDYLLYDLRYNLMLSAEPEVEEPPIVILDIDGRSLQAEGRWPWSRKKMARLIQRLYEEGAVMVGLDVVFSEPQRNLVEAVLEDVPEGLPTSVTRRLRSLKARFDYDQRLAESLGTDTVMGYILHDRGTRVGQLPSPVQQLSEQQRERLVVRRMSGYTANLPKLQRAALSAGFFTTPPDADGVIRRSPLVMRYGDALYASLALEMARQYLFIQSVEVQTVPKGDSLLMEGVELGRFEVSTDERGQVLVPYRGHMKYFPYVSATDLLNGRVEAGVLESALVLVGTSALATGDLKTTPLQASYPGVEVHASMLNGILKSRKEGYHFPFRPDLAHIYSVIAMLVIGGLLAVVQPKLSPAGMVTATVLVMVIAVGGNFYVWASHQRDVPLAGLLMLVAVLSFYNLAYGFWSANIRGRRVKEIFGQYVPPAHIDAMLSEPDAYGMEGESREMTVMFSDIRNFTSISEQLSATELKQMLNRFFTPITEEIFQYEGTIDKYVGDMVMAFWGAPLEDPAHAQHAVAASLAILARVEQLKAEFRSQGLPEINIGIGLNTGPMNVGDMGSHYRRAYTVLGDAVNLGARLEGVTKFYGVRLLVSEVTRDQAPDFLYRLVDRIRVKGKREPVTVYEPLCAWGEASDELKAQLERYQQAWQAYRERRWDDAEAGFRALLGEGEHPLYHVYLERIAELRGQGLGEGWDGVFEHTTK